MACTNSKKITWLNKFSKQEPHFNVSDDYEVELNQVHRLQGNEFLFSKGDYVVKTLLGPLDNLYVNIDQRSFYIKELEEYMGRKLSETELRQYKKLYEKKK